MSNVVAAVQFDPKLFKVRENIMLAKQLVFEASVKGAQCVVLPELCTTGCVFRSLDEASDVAQTKTGWQTKEFTEIAKKNNCHIIFGYVELYNGKLYNSAAVVGPNGLESNSQKHNLSGSDNLWAESSEQFPITVLTAAGRTGVLICRDVSNQYRKSYAFYKEGQRFYNKGDIDTIALLTNWGSGYGFPDSSWVELGEETGANIIVSNRVGAERDMKFKGGSCIIDKNKKVWTNGSNFDDIAIVGGLAIL